MHVTYQIKHHDAYIMNLMFVRTYVITLLTSMRFSIFQIHEMYRHLDHDRVVDNRLHQFPHNFTTVLPFQLNEWAACGNDILMTVNIIYIVQSSVSSVSGRVSRPTVVAGTSMNCSHTIKILLCCW